MANKAKNDRSADDTTNAKPKSVARETAEAIFIALLLALFIRTFIVQAFKIPSGSMMNTLLIGDHILVSKFSYGIHIPNEIPFLDIKLFDDIVLFSDTPERGDVIVFKFPKNESKDFIKRVVGVPGDLLEIRDQQVYINNKLLDEPYVWHQDPDGMISTDPRRDNLAPILVPPGHLFMMGDNRENSQDSRFWGLLDVAKVKGRAQIIYWSWDATAKEAGFFDGWVRFDRFGKSID
ncbi:MAG: signal peptidase I [Candidatus Nitrohelix vancouverensis]|uniref:Signal peptidase I n=1 Tax=Candidatus Nitrohelix vancouverensis TaxID=2705534 RepID=A0A7T0C019_9BACT|nr:MAG: signal peptidase I [Candidatus Nitrohelix vancouverensis]